MADRPPATGMIFDGTVSKLKYTLSGVSKPKGTFNYFVGFYIRTHCICYIQWSLAVTWFWANVTLNARSLNYRDYLAILFTSQ